MDPAQKLTEIDHQLSSLENMVKEGKEADNFSAIFNEIVTNFESFRNVGKNEEETKSFEKLESHLRKVATQLGKDFDSIPCEVQTLIFSYLSPKEALAAMQVSSSWKQYADDEGIWKERVMSHPEIAADADQASDWKKYYQECITFKTKLSDLEQLLEKKTHFEQEFNIKFPHSIRTPSWGLGQDIEKETETSIKSDIAAYSSLLESIQKIDPSGLKHIEALIGKEVMDRAEAVQLKFDLTKYMQIYQESDFPQYLNEDRPFVKGQDKSGRHFFAFLSYSDGRGEPLLSLILQKEPEQSNWIAYFLPGGSPLSIQDTILQEGKPGSGYLPLKKLFREGQMVEMGFTFRIKQ